MRRSLACLAGVAALLAFAPAAQASNPPYHWARSSLTTPATVTVYPTVGLSVAHLAATEASMADWNAGEQAVRLVLGATLPANSCPYWAHSGICVSDAFSDTTWWFSFVSFDAGADGVHLYGTWIEFNLAHDVDPRHEVCQELGHSLGVTNGDSGTGVDPGPGSCMTNQSWLPSDDYPAAGDFQQVAALYNHVDSVAPPPPCKRKHC